MRQSTAGIVLAAGASTRMGQPKLIMPYGTSTVIGTVVDSMMTSAVDNFVVVTGFHADAVGSVLPEGTRIAHNDRASQGNASSLLTGLRAVGDVDAIVVVVGDMPGVSASSVNALISAWKGTSHQFYVSEYIDGRGHPLLIDNSLFDEIENLRGERALWSFSESLDRSSIGAVRLPATKPADINSLEDYQGALRSLGPG